jgi:hypothetical protein
LSVLSSSSDYHQVIIIITLLPLLLLLLLLLIIIILLILTSPCSPGMFDHLQVAAYGKNAVLSDVAQVTLKTPTLATINVFDPEVR